MPPLGAPPNPGGSTPITGNTFAGGAAGPAVTPANAQGLQGCFGQNYVDVVLSSAQILALLTTPITLVPAPGAGFMIVPTLAIIRVSGITAAYTDAGGAVSFTIGTMSQALAANTVFTGPTAGQRSQQIIAFAATSTAANPPTNENAPLQIQKATNNFAAGSGTAKVTIYYVIEVTS